MRSMVRDNQDVYRVVIVKKKKIVNPKYVPGLNAPYWLWLDGETVDFTWGPYNKIGTAKAILTRETLTGSPYHEPRHDVVSSRIEKAETKWITVDLGE